MNVVGYDWHLPRGVEIFRRHPRGSISKEDCSCVVRVARGISSGHFREHLAVTSMGHGVFKGVMKCRKIPGEEDMDV